MDPSIAQWIGQFGVAGMIAWMWLAERRASAARDAQLTEAHDRLMQERQQLAAVVSLVAQNTRAMAALEQGQGRLVSLVETMWSLRRAATAGRVGGAGGAGSDPRPVDLPT